MDGIEFEKAIITVLQEQNQLRGYALFGWTFSLGNRNLEIDGLLLLEPGIFVCYEAKCYSGVWTGDINSTWRCGNRVIASARNGNPYLQVQQYVFHIKDILARIDRIVECFRRRPSHERLTDILCVCGLIVVPDEAQIQIQNAHVDSINQDTIYSRSIHICHLSKLVKVLLELRPYNSSVLELIQCAGGLQYITRELIHNVPDIEQISANSNRLRILIGSGLSGQDREPVLDLPPLEGEIRTNVDPLPTIRPRELRNGGSSRAGELPNELGDSSRSNGNLLESRGYWSRLIWIVIFVVFGSLGSFVVFIFKYYQFINRPRLSKGELKIGILTQPEAYSALATYLEENIIPDDFANFLFGQGKKINVSIVGNSDLTYQQAQQSLINNEWDVAFTLSPALSVVAKESGYQFIARMFPDQPQFYRSALFVRSDSPIYSLKDLNSQTKVGLGDFKSMSSFYMPLYDLYGKTLTIETGLKRMSTQVKNGVVQVGAGVSTNVEKDRELRIIHVSRDIPGSGVYVTPTFSEREKTIIQQVLLNAPKEIQSKANYGSGKEPDYTEFMKIRTRVEEILSCADFSKNPVKLFCSANPLVIKGKINGSSLVDSVTLELKVMGENGTLYKVVVPRFIIPNFTQVQNKSIILKPTITPRQIDVNTYEVIITDPDQISIQEETISSQRTTPSPKPTPSPSRTNTPSPSPTPPVPPPEPPSGLLTGYVANIWDGDNITIKTPQNSMIDIRLACIDAPEMGQTPWGERSTQYIKQLLPVGTRINYRPADTDRYGRIVAEIFVNNQSINLKMVRQGEAVVYHRYLSSCEADRQKYLDAETQAQRQSLGFWSQPDPEMPWDFRRRNRN
jgi:endonuclease YncB( thermonuclease family)/ABC-type phosphate/phosphonate transport system substrate-binding protein